MNFVDRVKEQQSSSSYVRKFEDTLTAAFIKVVREEDSALADLIDRKFDIQNDTSMNFNQRADKYEELWNGADDEMKWKFAEADAKINNISRRARKIAATQKNNAAKERGEFTDDSIDHVIKQFRDAGASANVVQRFVDENALAQFSLTPHPTNPTTVEYTKAGLDLDKTLDDENSTGEDLLNALRKIHKTHIVGSKKTVNDETEETVAILDHIYDAYTKPLNALRDALEKHGYADEGASVKNSIIKVATWASGGDGDGNPNATMEALEDGIELLKQGIRKKYLETLEEIAGNVTIEHENTSNINEIKDRYKNNEYASFQDFVADLKEGASKVTDPEIKEGIKELIDKTKMFGSYYAEVDIRHNSNDIMDTIGRVLDVAGVIDEKEFKELGHERQEEKLAKLLSNKYVLNSIKDIELDDLTSDKHYKNLSGTERDTAIDIGETAKEIFGRLRVVAEESKENPDREWKLITAETSNAAHSLSAMMLAKSAGIEVGTKDSKIDFVTLTESVADLKQLDKLIETLLENDTYREHVEARGKLIVMIAKSDPVRRDGRGVEFEQGEAMGKVIKLANGESFEIPVYLGGGAAPQRGGGKVSEMPYIMASSAASAGASDMGPMIFTSQGHQSVTLFSPESVASDVIEGLVARNLSAKGWLSEVLPDDDKAKNPLSRTAKADVELYSKEAIKEYGNLTANPAFNELLEKGPWVSIFAGNAGSRTSARGEEDKGIGFSPSDIVGEHPKALDKRAISGERLVGHAGIFLFSLLSVKEGLENMQEHGGAKQNHEIDPLHNAYEHNKGMRTAMQNTAIVLAMVDFSNAWRMMAGESRPDDEKIKELADKFVHTEEPNKNSTKVTLAYLEQTTLETSKLVYKSMTGKEAGEDFRIHHTLQKTFPELDKQIYDREKQCECSSVIEAKLTRDMNNNKDEALSEINYRTLQAVYASTDVTNLPVGVQATLSEGRGKNGKHSSRIADESLELPTPLAALSQDMGLV